MPTVADCLRQHGEAYLQKFGDRMPQVQRKVLDAIRHCRSGEFGWLIYACPGCGHKHWVGRSCGNRHCPNCQHEIPDAEVAAHLGASGGRKSKRTLTAEQARAMVAAREAKKQNSS